MQRIKKLFLIFFLSNTFIADSYNDFNKPATFLKVDVHEERKSNPYIGPLLAAAGTATIPVHGIVAGAFFAAMAVYILYDEITKLRPSEQPSTPPVVPPSSKPKPAIPPPPLSKQESIKSPEASHSQPQFLEALMPNEFRGKLGNRNQIEQEVARGNYDAMHIDQLLSDAQQELTAGLPVDFSSFLGDKFQQLAFADQREILQMLVDLKASSPFFEAKKDFVDLLVSAYLLNKEHQTHKAFAITDFCYVLLKSGESAVLSVKDGLLNTVADLVHHPVEAVAAVTMTSAVVGYYINKVFTHVIGWGVDACMVPNQAKKDWVDYFTSWSEFIDRLKNGQFSLQDGIRTTVAGGIQLSAQYFLFKGLGNLYEKALEKALYTWSNVPKLSPAEYLATPEGMLFRATGEGFEKSTLLMKKIKFTKHSLERMKERDITYNMVQITLEKGKRFYDPKNKTINYVLENGFASGKDLLVGMNPYTYADSSIKCRTLN